jgi:hypothetical protein
MDKASTKYIHEQEQTPFEDLRQESNLISLKTSINRMLKHSVPLAQVFVESLEVTVITWIKVGNPLCGLDA